MSAILVICESPTKAKKLQDYLGSGYIVKASRGHICDLPTKDYGVDLTTFEESYVPREKSPIGDLKALAKSASEVLLAPDPDREGEAIAWHLQRELRLKPGAARRITFHEVTKTAILAAVQQARPVDVARVDAQRTRRVLDRIIGFDVSKEICWPAGAQSAGRVQTPALHILCVRERAIQAFVSRTYWTAAAEYAEGVVAVVADTGTDDTPTDEAAETDERAPGGLKPKQFDNRAEADAVLAEARQHPHIVQSVDQSPVTKRPELPYTTSTLQQDASRKLRWAVKQTAEVAQKLFEAGHITYHRTDSTRVSPAGQQMARDYLTQTAPHLLPAAAPTQKTKAGAQDAHEAIRPTALAPKPSLSGAEQQLYDLIWARFVASQCVAASFTKTRIVITAGKSTWVAQGSVLVTAGYLEIWRPYAKVEDEPMPAVAQGQTLTLAKGEIHERQTTPPSRFDTGGFVRKLETSGIGRPSTYEPIIRTLLERGYVRELELGKQRTALQPTELGLKTDALLEATLPDLVAEEYTAAMEAALDGIEHTTGPGRVPYLRTWYEAFRSGIATALPIAAAYRQQHNMHATPKGGEATDITCDRCGTACYRKVTLKGGKGSFLACDSCQMKREVKAKVQPGACPRCQSALIERVSPTSKEKYWSCVRYKADERPCDYRANAAGKESGAYVRTAIAKPCPKCKHVGLVKLVPTDPAKGVGFIACDNPRKCTFIMDVGARRRPQDCPECAGMVLEKRRKNGAGTFWSCVNYPVCTFSSSVDGDAGRA